MVSFDHIGFGFSEKPDANYSYSLGKLILFFELSMSNLVINHTYKKLSH